MEQARDEFASLDARASIVSGSVDRLRAQQNADGLDLRQDMAGAYARMWLRQSGGFADAAPVGDSALATALQRLHKLPERPDHDQVKTLMADFSPYRSLATMHLWTYLKEPGPKEVA